MAAPSFEVGRPSALSVEVRRIVERGLKECKAVDCESLCIVAGEKVWAVRITRRIIICTVHLLFKQLESVGCTYNTADYYLHCTPAVQPVQFSSIRRIIICTIHLLFTLCNSFVEYS